MSAHEFNALSPFSTLEAAQSFAERLASAATLSDRLELRLEHQPSPSLLIGGPDGFGFFGTTAFRWVRLALPCTPRAIAIAVARHALGEYWASDDEIVAEHARLPLAFAIAFDLASP
jgi:hypothetical protein